MTQSAADNLGYLRVHKLGDCERCMLHTGRTNVVFGEGNAEANVMFVGEAPGYDEDRTGRPFVGRAGRLLDKILEEVGLQRGEIYITNILKCRPEGNRDPQPSEVEVCTKFLRVQIALIKPKVLIALGRHAGNLLSGRRGVPMRTLREQSWLYFDEKTNFKTLVRCLYHPAWVLRQEDEKSHQAIVQDLKEALEAMRNGELPERAEDLDTVVEDPEPEVDIQDLFGSD